MRPIVSSFSFAIFASACRISSRTSSTTSIFSIPNHDVVVLSSKYVVSSIRCAIYPVISLASNFNCSIGSLFSNSSILALYSASTTSILTTSAWVCTTNFYTFSNMKASSSSCMPGSSKHNSTIALFRLTSSCFRCVATAAVLGYLFSALSHSCVSAAFSTLASYSLSLNSSTICACRILNTSEGIAAKSNCTAPSYSPSCALGWHMLIGVLEMNRCSVPFGFITTLCILDGVATCGAWLTNVFSSMSCASIVYFSASYVVVIVVISSDILSQTLSTMFSKSSSCNTA